MNAVISLLLALRAVLPTPTLETPSAVVASPPGITVTVRDKTPPFTGQLCLRLTGPSTVDLQPSGTSVYSGQLVGLGVYDSRPDEPGWALAGHLDVHAGGSPHDVGWTPSVVRPGTDAEGTVTAGPTVDPARKTPSSKGLAAPGTVLASAGPGAGLGTTHLSAALVLSPSAAGSAGTLTATLTLTLVSP
jgi:hypothetical protein